MQSELSVNAAQTNGVPENVRSELESGARMLYRGEHVVAFVPVCARYPYEVWIAPIEPVPASVAC